MEPRLRLFLSADIIGSTALKQTRLGAHKSPMDQAVKGPAWFSAIQGFYIEAAQAFFFDWERSQKASEDSVGLYGPAPQIWKTIGDEVLFVKQITDHRQLITTLHCWMRALQRVKEFLRIESPLLDVKSACWTAGFPFRNREVVINSDIDFRKGRVEDYYRESGLILNNHYSKKKSSSISVDFIGPSIDTGFRLGAHSTGRKMVVSVDVAYIVAMTHFDGEVSRVDLFYDGSVSLKGVFGGSNYPVFWVDLSSENSLSRKEDKLRSQACCVKEDVKEYCDIFYKEHADFTFRPFIDGDPDRALSKKPAWYAEYQEKLIANFNSPEDDYARDDSVEAHKPGGEIDEATIEGIFTALKKDDE